MNPQPKSKRVKNPKYLKFVASIGCVICCQSAVAHHLCNRKNGAMGSKADDFLTFALCNHHHSATSKNGIHRDVKKWESQWQKQEHYILNALNIAFDENVINEKIWRKYTCICEKSLF